MQSIKLSFYETLTTLINDNLNNLVILYLAIYVYKVPVTSCVPLFIIGNFLNAFTSFYRRRYFAKIQK